MSKGNPHLLLRGKIYYFNAWIPKDVSNYFGNKDCIRRSLKTSDVRAASKKARLLAVHLERIISRIRSGMYSEDVIKKWVKEYFSLDFWLFEHYSAAGGFENCIPEIRKSGYKEREQTARNDLARGNFSRITEDAEYWLKKRNIELDSDDLQFKYFCREILKAEIQFYRILQKRVDGDYDDAYSNLESEFIIKNETITPSHTEKEQRVSINNNHINNNLSHETKSISLKNAIEKYFEGYRTDNRVHKKSLDEFESICQLFIDLVGDINVTDIDDDTITLFIKKLSRIPKNKNKDKRWRNFSALQLSEMDIPLESLMSETTVNKYIQRISSLLNYCFKKRRWIKFNPAEGRTFSRTINKKGKRDKKRFPYDKHELQSLINHLGTLKNEGILKTNPERFFIPVIALFAGLRLQEICQLYIDDIYIKDDIMVFDINEKTPDKSLKTESSARLVPFHPILKRIGFLDYIEKLRKTRNKRLWPQLNYALKFGYKRKFSRWFDPFNRKQITVDTKKVFHSLRHNFSNCMRQDVVPLDVRESLLGHHQPELANADYSEPLHPKKLLEEGILKIDYGIDLDTICSKH